MLAISGVVSRLIFPFSIPHCSCIVTSNPLDCPPKTERARSARRLARTTQGARQKQASSGRDFRRESGSATSLRDTFYMSLAASAAEAYKAAAQGQEQLAPNCVKASFAPRSRSGISCLQLENVHQASTRISPKRTASSPTLQSPMSKAAASSACSRRFADTTRARVWRLSQRASAPENQRAASLSGLMRFSHALRMPSQAGWRSRAARKEIWMRSSG